VFVERKHGGPVMTLLSIMILLVGGGFVATFVGIADACRWVAVNIEKGVAVERQQRWESLVRSALPWRRLKESP
jgi:hypothetical protein